MCGLKLGYLTFVYERWRSHPSWVCGLKHSGEVINVSFDMSHPSWVCGLKLCERILGIAFAQSHPSWVCGLKPRLLMVSCVILIVTPFVGVWIETTRRELRQTRRNVTPFVGVWIETRLIILILRIK